MTAQTTCLGGSLTVETDDSLQQIFWYKDGNLMQSSVKPIATSYGITVAGGEGQGSAKNQFSGIGGIWIDKNGNVYISDSRNHRIQKWAAGASSAATIAGGNGGGNLGNQFNWPSDIFIDKLGNIYVTDILNSRVQKWVPGAIEGVTVAGGNGQGRGANQLFLPSAVVVDNDLNVFVVDQQNHRIQKWPPGATEGITVAGGYPGGSMSNQLLNPVGMWLDEKNNLFVADAGNNRIQKWSPGAAGGTTVAGGNGYGNDADQLANPIDVFVDTEGNIYIADNNNHRIQKWPPEATEGVTVAGGNGSGTNADQLNLPGSIFVSEKGELFIGDTENYRIQKWMINSMLSTNYTPTAPGTYTSSVITQDGCVVHTNSVIITPILDLSISIQASQTEACENTPVSFSASVLNGGHNLVYKWEKNGLPVDSHNPTYADSSLKDGDKIGCTITSNQTCLSKNTSSSPLITMTINPKPQISLNKQNVLCHDEKRVLNPGFFASYLWNDGRTTRTITVDTIGVYSVTVTDYKGCKNFDEAAITVLQAPVKGILPPDTLLCNYQKIELIPAGIYTEYLWNTGIRSKNITVSKPGLYWLNVKDQYKCLGIDSINIYPKDCIEGFYAPTAFTPNNDGKNDEFKITLIGEVEIFDLKIYNRWGQIVFKSNNPVNGWNGTHANHLKENGAYVWVCSFRLVGETTILKQGTIMLLH